MRVFCLLPIVLMGACTDPVGPAKEVAVQWVSALPAPKATVARHRSAKNRWARRPRFSRGQDGGALRTMPDGSLGEWRSRQGLIWSSVPALGSAAGHAGEDDASARVAWGSYAGGLSLAVRARDDRHVPAKHLGAFGRADWVELELWPLASHPDDRPKGKHPVVGVKLALGTHKQLVRFVKPRGQSWRAAAVVSFGAQVAGGWQLEARFPLSVLTPLPSPRVGRLRYRVTIHDADGERSEPTLRLAGELALRVPMRVPEAVRRRVTVRSCMARFEAQAFWGYQDGWRCTIPYPDLRLVDDNPKGSAASFRFSYLRIPEPPRLVYLRERLLLLNFPGLGRGLAALVSKRKRIHSLLDLGVVGADDPGNALTRESDAEPLRLPDGTWAVAVTHAYPARGATPLSAESSATSRGIPFGASCARGHRVFLSVIAAKGAPHVTPDRNVPEPDPPPQLREVFRTKLADCLERSVLDWALSKDRRTITVRDVLRPHRALRRYVFRDGRYRLQPRREPKALAMSHKER